jgi:two-component system, sensor histidine kinase and response regulator
MRVFSFWKNWGLVSRLMLAVGIAIVIGGGVQTFLFIAEGASENSARLKRELSETLSFVAPLIADQALVGEYAAIDQLVKKQVTKGELDRIEWADKDGRKLIAQDKADVLDAPAWFTAVAAIEVPEESVEVTAGGVGYGKLYARMTPIKAHNRLWKQFVKQLQIVAATLFLMLQFIWLIFRGNLGTLRMLAESANRFSQGDRSVRITPDGAPEVRLAAEAFNNMANNTESLLASLGTSESKNRLLATIVEQSSEAIWTKDLSGAITTWNAGATAMLGYSPEAAIGHKLAIDESSAADDAARMKRLAAGARFSYDTKALTQSGAHIDLQVAVAPLVNEANECIGTIAVARDVTQSKRGEEALRQARGAAEAANHAKSSFLARMSHEIRTPMNGVLGMTELLLETGLSSVQRKYAETVQSSGKNLLAIINDVLDFSKIEAGKLELEKVNLDLRKSLEDTVDLLAERAHAKGLELACRIPSDLETQVKGDPLRLSQILTNLMGNAIKFTQKGSVVVNLLGEAQTESTVTIRFEVTDTGEGISQEAQSRIFEEFSQADGSTTRKHGGSGLGLAISRQLVEMMGGELHVESVLGAGATFWFTCTFAKQQSGTPVYEPSVLMGTLTGLKTLIIESGSVSRGILQSQVSNWGMHVRVAETPEHGVELLLNAAALNMPFDLALIDLGFVGSDTFELAKTIKRHAPLSGVRLVMLTPVGNHATVKAAHEAQLNACLVKPVRQSELYACLVDVMTGERPQPEALAGVVAEIASQPMAGSRGKILLVEDNLVNQAVALGMLQKIQGYEVVVANNGREALADFKQGGFDAILMDCHMPELDGFEATIAIRKLEQASGKKRIPIIALTANAMAQDRQDCLNAGMDDHLSKPLSRKQLQDMLELWMPSPDPTTPAALDGAAKAVTADVDVLDRQLLAQLRELQSEDDPDLLSRVLNLYLVESPKLVVKLVQSTQEANAEEIERSSHALKSSSGNVGATELARLCTDIQNAARASNVALARDLVPKFEVEFERVVLAIKEEIRQEAASANAAGHKAAEA